MQREKKNKGYYNLKMNKLIATFFLLLSRKYKKKVLMRLLDSVPIWKLRTFYKISIHFQSFTAKEREGIGLLELYINWIEYAQGQQLSHRAKLQIENNIYDSKLPFSWFYR